MGKEILNYTYSIFTSDWDTFKSILSRNKNIVFGTGERDDNGVYDYAFLKKEKIFVAKYYTDDMEISTDIKKSDFFKYLRGSKLDIENIVMSDVMEKSTYVLSTVNNAGIYIPTQVVEGLTLSKSVLESLNEKSGKVVVVMESFDSMKSRLTSRPSLQNMEFMNIIENLKSK